MQNIITRGQHHEGFTLVEMLVVLGIIGLLTAVVAPQIIHHLSTARTGTATAQIKNIETALEFYYLDVGAYPSQSDGLAALFITPSGAVGWSGPYLKTHEGIIDPWKHEYLYRSPGNHGDFDVYSYGRDQREGGDGENGDVASW